MTSKQQPRAGDWFVIPLEGDAVSLGYAAAVTADNLMLAYVFAVDAPLVDEPWQRLRPEDALYATRPWT